MDDDDTVADALAHALVSGTLLLVSRPSRLSAARPEGLRHADDATRTRPRDDGGRRPEAPRATTWIEIVCVGLTGVTYAGATVRMRIPGGDRIDVRLDANSSVRIDDLPQGPSCSVELSRSATRTGVMPLDQRPRLRGGEPRIRRGGAEVQLATAARHVLVVEGLHGFSCRARGRVAAAGAGELRLVRPFDGGRGRSGAGAWSGRRRAGLVHRDARAEGMILLPA